MWGHHDWLEWHTWHFNPNWLLSRPQQWLLQQNVRNWLISRPLCFTLQIDSFQDPASYMAKRHKLIPFQTITFYVRIDSFQDPKHFRAHISGKDTPSSELHQTQPNWLISRPLNWIIQCFYLHGRLPAKSPWETTFKKFHQNPLQSEFWTFSRK